MSRQPSSPRRPGSPPGTLADQPVQLRRLKFQKVSLAVGFVALTFFGLRNILGPGLVTLGALELGLAGISAALLVAVTLDSRFQLHAGLAFTMALLVVLLFGSADPRADLTIISVNILLPFVVIFLVGRRLGAPLIIIYILASTALLLWSHWDQILALPTLSPLLNLAGGSVLATMLAIYFSSTWESAETALAAARDHLESQVDRRTRELRHSQQRWQGIWENAVVGLSQVTEDGRFLMVNDQLARIFGYESKEAFLEEVENIVGLYADPSQRRGMVARIKAQGKLDSAELAFRRRDGKIIWLLMGSRAINHPDHGLVFEGYFADITSRKEVEAELIRSERELASILDSTPDIIYRLDTSGRITYVNVAVERYGYTPEELVGRDATDLAHPDDRERLREHMAERRTGDRRTKALTVRLLAGPHAAEWPSSPGAAKEYIFLLDAVGLYSGDPHSSDNFLGTQGVARDITDRRRLEMQLAHAQKMEAVGTLASGVAHDFNNLLQAISGYSELLNNEGVDSRTARAHIAQISGAVDRAADLVSRLLTLGRKREIKHQSLDLNRTVRQAVMLLERTIPKMIGIETVLADELSPVWGDAAQVEQILMNLGTNARDAMPGGGRLTLYTADCTVDAEFSTAHPEVAPGPYVCLSVTDTGQGMDGETVQRVFEPFFTTKGQGRGTGLGLAMAYAIVTGMGGCITCHSRPGEGTVFRLYLPAAPQGAGQALSEAPQDLPTAPAGGATILIVDDEPAMLDFGRQLLTPFGYQVLTASSGEEALEVYRHGGDSVDGVILDLIMPGMGGLNALKQLRDLNPGAKVLIASGYAAEGEVERALACGAAGYLGKPFKAGTMLTTLRAMLDGDKAPA